MGEPWLLLVEDTTSDEALVLRALATADTKVRVLVARDGEQALALVLGDEPPASLRDLRLILLDLHLPKIGGLQVLEQLRTDPRSRRLPIVVFSASRAAEDVRRAYGLGASSYVHKPDDYAQFSQAVSLLARYWFVLNEPAPP